MQYNNELLRNHFVYACDDAISCFRQKDEIYNAAVKRRADISNDIQFLFEGKGELLITAEQRSLLAEYYGLLTGSKELDVYVACYERGIRDTFFLLERIGILKCNTT